MAISDRHPRRFEEQVVLVTGGGRGIGRAAAELFAAEGAQVMIATRSEAPGREALAAIAAAGGSAELHVADLRTRAAVRETVAATLARFGRLDVVVHNAAACPYATIADLDDAVLDDLIDVNLKPIFWLSAEALPALEASGSGAILVVSSITGNREWQPGYAAYGVTKAGLNAFVRMNAGELGGKGIRINGVEPGLTITDLASQMPAEQLEKISGFIPLGAPAKPIDIARALVFLGSRDASHITGQMLAVDGGQNLAGPR